MKKRLILYSLIFLILFSSCSKNKEQEEMISRNVNSFIFELARYSLTGECDIENPKNYFFPPELNKYVGMKVYEKGQTYPLIEKYFPEKQGVIESSGFYVPALDSADWVEELLIQIEEERIADEISEMENESLQAEYIPDSLDEYERDITETLEKDAKADEISGKTDELRIMKFNTEIFMPYSKGNTNIVIEANGNEVLRKFYDENYRLLKSEQWKIGSVNDAVLLDSEEYVFDGDNYRPSEKIVRSETDVNHTFYNSEGHATKTEKYIIYKKGKKTSEILVSVFEWTYNEDEKVSSESSVTYVYGKDYKKLDYTFEKKHVYAYNDFTDTLSEEDNDKIPADFEYFEDGILKMKNKYSAELGTYTSQVFFDNDFSVKTTYEKYKRKKEVYSSGDEVVRIKEYE